jgi:hypothetical protein
MATILDYLIPHTMAAGRQADEYERMLNAKKVAAWSAQPDVFQGVNQARVPPPEILAAYQGASGSPWPMAPDMQTGAPPPGLQEPVPGLASNMPQETLAIMRSPIAQTTNEMNEKTVAETLAKLKAQEAGLAAQGDLPARQMQKQMETLGSTLGPVGFTPMDIGASIAGRYPMAAQKELATARGDTNISPTELALKAAGGDPRQAMQLMAQMHREGLRDAGVSTGKAAQAPPVVKLAQQFMQKFGPYVSQQLPPMMQMLAATGTLSPEVIQAVQAAPIDPTIKQQFLYYSKILDQWTKSQMTEMGMDPSALAQPSAPAPAPSNDPLGIR